MFWGYFYSEKFGIYFSPNFELLLDTYWTYDELGWQ